jgi:hypothetical protein
MISASKGAAPLLEGQNEQLHLSHFLSWHILKRIAKSLYCWSALN